MCSCDRNILIPLSGMVFGTKKHHVDYVMAFEDYPSSQSLIACMIASAVMRFRVPLLPTSRKDSEYIRNGTCSIFAFIEPLGGMHHVSVRKCRMAKDWAEEMKYLSDVKYPDAEKIILVMDNLNIHNSASLYKAFPPKEARRIKNDLKYTIHQSMEVGLI